jgi:superfamily II DNA or RNA helicase
VFNLRYYQGEAIEACRNVWERRQGAIVVAATGTGKTEIYLSAAVQQAGRVLVLAHRDYLLDQPINRLAAQGFDDVAIEKAEHRSEGTFLKAQVVFASVQSLCKERRLATFRPTDFSLIIVDEAHRAVAVTYRKIIDYFCAGNPNIRVLFVTATPKRKDNVALGNLCNKDVEVAYTYGPKRAADEGWIVPLRFYRREVKDLDFSTVRLKGADLDQEAIEQLMVQEGPLHRVCSSLAEDRGPTIIFCPGVKVAQAYAALINQRYRPNTAIALWAHSTAEERERAGKRLANGELEYLFNVDLATEGYDVPELCRVVWAAPTASLVKFTQGTGRVFRPHASLRGKLTGGSQDAESRRELIAQSPKPVGHVVTYYPQNCRHQLCEPNDILGGDELPEDVRGIAKMVQEATAAQVNGSDPEEDVETAKAYVELRALLDVKRKEIRAKSRTSDVEYDGFGGSRNRQTGTNAGNEKQAARQISEDWPGGAPASDKQIGWLRYKGIANAKQLGITKWRASCLRDLIEKAKFTPADALACSKKQALAILSKFKEPST